MNRRPFRAASARCLAGALALAAAGCRVVGPEYERPAVAAPAAFPGARATGEPVSRWWTSFGDPELDALVNVAVERNLDLRAAAERIRVARIAVRQAGISMEPRLDGSGSFTRSRTEEMDAGGGPFGPSKVGGDPDDRTSLTAGASWELDLWGRVRRLTEAAEADVAALEDDRLAVQVMLVADLVEAWLDASEAEAEAAVQRETVDLLAKTLSLVRSRVDAGLASEIDLRRTEGDIATAEARIPAAARRRAAAEHRIALLLGEAPGRKVAPRAPSAFREPSDVPTGLPAALLDRRPDLRAAERRIAASSARIGVAVADFYPRVTLLGSAGWASNTPATFGEWSSRVWSIGPAVSLPLLDGGRREYEVLRREAERDAAAAEWLSAFHRALAEVADGISSLDTTRAERAALRRAVDASRRSVELADVRYREGLTGYLEVLDAQRALAQSKLGVLAADRAVLSSVVRLCRALGGGWEPAAARTSVAPAPVALPPVALPAPASK
ncbi:MAG: Outer membrane protein OprM [Planctomycetes bacterium]|nr:Outer membrane protein OprM [Planctomycetota bacterium]